MSAIGTKRTSRIERRLVLVLTLRTEWFPARGCIGLNPKATAPPAFPRGRMHCLSREATAFYAE